MSRLFLLEMPQSRHPKGTKQGGQYAPGTRAVDTQIDPLRLPHNGTAEATPDEVVVPRSDIPVALARYGKEWRVEPRLSVTPFGVLAAATSTDIPLIAEQLHIKAVKVIGWSAILTNMLNAGDLTTADAAALLPHMVDHDNAAANRGKRSIMAKDKSVLDMLPDDLQNAQPFLAIAYLETKGRILLDDTLTNTNPGELMLRELLDVDVTPGFTKSIAHTLEKASGMCFRSDPRTQWTDFTARLKLFDSSYRLERGRNHKRRIQSGNVYEQFDSVDEQPQRPYAAPNQHLWEKCEIGTRFGKPNSFAQLYERYQAVGLPSDAFLDELQIARVFIDKARDLRSNPQALTDWWKAQKSHLRYDPSTLESAIFCDLYVLHGGNPTPEGADAAMALHTVWGECQIDDTKQDMIEMVLLPGFDTASSPEEGERYTVHQRGIGMPRPSWNDSAGVGALKPADSGVLQRWSHFAAFLSDHSGTLEDARRYAHECAPGMSFP